MRKVSFSGDNAAREIRQQLPEPPRHSRNPPISHNITIPEQNSYKDMRNQRNYSERLDIYGKPFGARPSSETSTTTYNRETTNSPQKRNQEKGKQPEKAQSPMESSARRQRVLECETQGLMAKTAALLLEASLLEGAINREVAKVPSPDLVVSMQPIQPQKRGRPSGKSSTNATQQLLRGAGSKKRKVVIQNSP
ncbi:hypothetical protein DY000_02009442 [Brassica cretica]|uniref:DUF4005 domain-containing protein n=1 Tax=Brassica cretica TaxID=69181 RepID=A0ABQ7CE15_BRACR|nr:hypothetical protein DY000_02009442 [Brassica cretica]